VKLEKLKTMKTLFVIYFLTIFSTAFCSIPGKLLLIGGGSDRSIETAWNQIPYQWAVDHSINKRVAIIGYVDNEGFYEDYFIDNCNAVAATYFKIANAEDADDAALYDTLITYGMVFIKGGNQANYYNYYKGTKTEEALEYIFNNGGVIAGTSAGCAILSKVTYAALNNSADPLVSMRNYQSTDITLRDDFLDFFPGYVFDTHFGERGRFPRLVAFMENWKFNTGENIIGIGVDDLTTLAIDSTMIGTVYGTGSVNFFKVEDDAYDFSDSAKVIIDSVSVKQLLHGCTYNFNTGEITGLEETSEIDIEGETGNYTIFASGYELITRNEEMLDEFISVAGGNNIVIISKSGSDYASEFQSELIAMGVNSVEIIEATIAMGEDVETNQKIEAANKFLIIDNEYTSFMSFLETTNGNRLKIKLKADNAVSAFIGDNSRFIGRFVVNNYEVSWASYDGDLTFDAGLDLLHTTVIMPKSYFNSDTYENKATGVPRIMLEKKLKYGVWLNRYCYMKYYPMNGKTYITGNGESPVVMLVNHGSKYGFSNQTSIGDGTQTPRMASGFDNMSLHFFDYRDSIKVGDEIIETSLLYPHETINTIITTGFSEAYVFQNLAEFNSFFLFDCSGRLLISKYIYTNSFLLDTDNLDSGLYIANFRGTNGKNEKIKIVVR